jgi:preprotein translocase subunit SecY
LLSHLQAVPTLDPDSVVKPSLAEDLYREVEAMKPENFLVRMRLEAVERFQNRAAWEQIDEGARETLQREVAGLPSALGQTFELGRTGVLSTPFIFVIIAIVIALITLIVFMERAQRRIVIQYPKRQMGNKMYGGESTHMPLKVNTAGVIPPIFASSILLFPLTIASFNAGGDGTGFLQTVSTYLAHGQPLYIALYVFLIVFFCFFYTSIVFNPEDTAENLRKYGGFLPGIRPGKRTAEYLDYVLSRLTVIGAGYITAVCLVPELLVGFSGAPNAARALGGTSILIVVSVTMDTVAQIQSHLLAHQYEGLIKKSKLRGGRR